MIAQASSRERTETEWHRLIESCGLEIAAIDTKNQGNEAFIEVVVPWVISLNMSCDTLCTLVKYILQKSVNGSYDDCDCF